MGREEILGALDQALVDLPDRGNEVAYDAYYSDALSESGDLLSQFKRKLESLHGECIVGSLAIVIERVAKLIAEYEGRAIVAGSGPLIQRIAALDRRIGDLPVVEQKTMTHDAMAALSIGISEADALIARTGSVVIRTTSAGGRRLSVLPEVHVVLATETQILPQIGPWLREIKAQSAWSVATIITGPSRTADIEKILVLGAHGPKRLIVCIVRE